MKLTHIYHSGFCLELAKEILIFDWYTGALPDLPQDKKLIVLVSHSHADHYNPRIWELRNRFQDVTYVLDEGISVENFMGGEPASDAAAPVSLDADGAETSMSLDADAAGTRRSLCEIVKVQPLGAYQISEGVTVYTFESNDMGVAFLVDAHGKTIFHAGDLNVWFWQEGPDRTHADNLASEAFCRSRFREVKAVLENLHRDEVDLAMLLLDTRLEEEAPRQIALFQEAIGAKKVVPMHYWDDLNQAQSMLSDPRIASFRDIIDFSDVIEC